MQSLLSIPATTTSSPKFFLVDHHDLTCLDWNITCSPFVNGCTKNDLWPVSIIAYTSSSQIVTTTKEFSSPSKLPRRRSHLAFSWSSNLLFPRFTQSTVKFMEKRKRSLTTVLSVQLLISRSIGSKLSRVDLLPLPFSFEITRGWTISYSCKLCRNSPILDFVAIVPSNNHVVSRKLGSFDCVMTFPFLREFNRIFRSLETRGACFYSLYCGYSYVVTRRSKKSMIFSFCLFDSRTLLSTVARSGRWGYVDFLATGHFSGHFSFLFQLSLNRRNYCESLVSLWSISTSRSLDTSLRKNWILRFLRLNCCNN